MAGDTQEKKEAIAELLSNLQSLKEMPEYQRYEEEYSEKIYERLGVVIRKMINGELPPLPMKKGE